MMVTDMFEYFEANYFIEGTRLMRQIVKIAMLKRQAIRIRAFMTD